MFPTNYNEKELLRKIATGDEKAFRTVYDAYFNRLSAYVFKLSKSETATEEIVQDVFTRLWQNTAAVQEAANYEAYLFTIARNRTFDYLRQLARETDLITLLSEQVRESPSAAEEKLRVDELHALIRQALEKLSKQKQMVFHLSRNEGLSHDEIAQRLNISKSTVKNHLSETLRHIRTHLSGHYDAELLLLLILLKSF